MTDHTAENVGPTGHTRLEEIRERYGRLALVVGDQGGGDRTLNDIDFLLSLIEEQRGVLEAVDRLFSDVMTEENLHIHEPVARRVTAVLAHSHSSGEQADA